MVQRAVRLAAPPGPWARLLLRWSAQRCLPPPPSFEGYQQRRDAWDSRYDEFHAALGRLRQLALRSPTFRALDVDARLDAMWRWPVAQHTNLRVLETAAEEFRAHLSHAEDDGSLRDASSDEIFEALLGRSDGFEFPRAAAVWRSFDGGWMMTAARHLYPEGFPPNILLVSDSLNAKERQVLRLLAKTWHVPTEYVEEAEEMRTVESSENVTSSEKKKAQTSDTTENVLVIFLRWQKKETSKAEVTQASDSADATLRF
eukprot:TRINITY_DN8947_c0_g1_i3.p1 TRINITY_DN8947_c0_g1~~TRINITY_DN8947_c0_g1_i3.p1  ORF type:complete len:276 (-),score=78.91 TRINITY_DN8947_c0_g1_i3:30-803(-)